ncbi:MAG: hypothetical protein J2P17_30815, partial [Mycobacterium sp.]|nr:hypothetical protein [Mycobacterium sp.]
VRFSVTAKMDTKIKTAIAAIPETAWRAIKYPKAIFDHRAGGWVSDALFDTIHHPPPPMAA